MRGQTPTPASDRGEGCGLWPLNSRYPLGGDESDVWILRPPNDTSRTYSRRRVALIWRLWKQRSTENELDMDNTGVLSYVRSGYPRLREARSCGDNRRARVGVSF
jgi:hypothetical protein